MERDSYILMTTECLGQYIMLLSFQHSGISCWIHLKCVLHKVIPMYPQFSESFPAFIMISLSASLVACIAHKRLVSVFSATFSSKR